MVNVEKIQKLLKKHFSIQGDVHIDPHTGVVDVTGNVRLKEHVPVQRLPVQFGTVSGWFACEKNNLTTLEGSPRSVYDFICSHNSLTSLGYCPARVEHNFDCGYNQITSLKGGPTQVGGSYECNANLLTSLVGAPQEVPGVFNCRSNNLKSLEGSPTKVGYNYDCGNNKLTSLKGAPEQFGYTRHSSFLGGDFGCDGNQLQSLEGAPEQVPGDFWCGGNLFHTLKGIPHTIGKRLGCTYSPTLPMLSLLWVNIDAKGIYIPDAPAKLLEIIHKYKPMGKKGALACAAEMIKAGYKDNARW